MKLFFVLSYFFRVLGRMISVNKRLFKINVHIKNIDALKLCTNIFRFHSHEKKIDLCFQQMAVSQCGYKIHKEIVLFLSISKCINGKSTLHVGSCQILNRDE